eukprot:GHRR01036848.1.p1 GENE.GHRR01036848.1~~GHRR01036848.1.p1  ORF type:complete len:238 (-),score=49.07 GHRR01036848.1:455-1168(-)
MKDAILGGLWHLQVDASFLMLRVVSLFCNRRLLAAFWHGLTALLFTAILPFWISDPVTVVKAGPDECSGPRRWSSHTLHLPEFHHTARVLGHSVNALAVTCLAGGIRRYMLRHGVAVANRVRLCSMVDTRSMPGLLTGTSGNSNNFSFIGVPLFTGDCGPLVRLARAGWALSWIRHSLAVPLAIRMPSIIQVGPVAAAVTVLTVQWSSVLLSVASSHQQVPRMDMFACAHIWRTAAT